MILLPIYFFMCVLGILPVFGIVAWCDKKYDLADGTLVTIFIVCVLLSPITFCVLIYKGVKHCCRGTYKDWDKLFPNKPSDEVLMPSNGDVELNSVE